VNSGPARSFFPSKGLRIPPQRRDIVRP
jgi:hypothetical protein